MLITYNLLRNKPETKEELEASLNALGEFCRVLREKNISYYSNIRDRRKVLEHLIRFQNDTGYILLATDCPNFENGNDNDDENGFMVSSLKYLFRFSSSTLHPIIREKIEEGYHAQLPSFELGTPVSKK